MSRLERRGMSLDERHFRRLEDLAENLDSRRSQQVSVSEAAREIIPLGITAWEIIDESSSRPMTTRDMEGVLRQALYDFEDWGDPDDTDVLLRELADRKDVDPDDLEQAILRLQLDD